MYRVGPPPSPSFKYTVFVQGVKITAELQNLAQKAANETPAQASQRKAAAIVAEINKGITAAIANGQLPAGTAMATVATQPATVPNVDKNGNPIPGQPATKPNAIVGYGTIVLPNFTGFGDPKDFNKDFRDPSGEPKGSAIRRRGGGSGSPKGGMNGTGSSTGLSTGFDPLGFPSFVAFGLFEPRALASDCATDTFFISDCPGAYIATLGLLPGMNDAQVFNMLASLFNSQFAASGFTATYDPALDLLSIDQPLNNFLTLYTQNTDPGLILGPTLNVVPEPSSLLLFGTALSTVALVGARRRTRARRRGPTPV
jgi:hypothetical protein